PKSPCVGPVPPAPGCVLGRPRTSSTRGSLRPCQPSTGPRATVKGPRTRGTTLWAMTAQPQPWAAGSATGIGSHPGTDPGDATAAVVGELPDLPYLPELPARGPAAAMIGRTVSLLVDLPAETVPSGWRFTDRPGRDVSRARSWLGEDLDTVEERAEGYTGPVKIQI